MRSVPKHDAAELERGARVLLRHSPAAREWGGVEELVDQMRWLAKRYLYEASFVATRGFVLTGIDMPDGSRAFRASVAATILERDERPQTEAVTGHAARPEARGTDERS